jgi:hypothetical protein
MRRLWIGLLAALLVLGSADTVAWYLATDRLAAGFAAWRQAEQTAGWTIRAGRARRAGWPLSADLVVPHMQVTPKPDEPWPVTWRVQRLMLRLRPHFPLRLSIAAMGRQTLGPSAGPGIPFTASRFVLHLPWHPDPRAAAVDMVVRGLRVDPARKAAEAARPESAGPRAKDAATTTPGQMSLGALRLRLDWHQGGTAAGDNRGEGNGLDFALVVRDVVLPRGHPPGHPWPLGRRIASIAAHGALQGPVPQIGSPRQRLAAWQHAGGQVVLREAALRWGPLTASLAATFGLDPALQPEGQGRAMLSGYAQALDTMAANGAVTNNTAVAAKAVLSLLTIAPRPGGSDTVTVPVRLGHGVLSVEGLPLLRLPPLQLAPPPAQ